MASIVFDLDGTLIDSAPDICGIANQLLKSEGAPEITLAQARSFVGNGAAVFVQKMRATAGIPDSEQARLLEAFVSAYDTAVGLTHPYPGVPEALIMLRDAGHRLGVCTNKPLRPTHAVLAHLELGSFFDVVLGGDSLPVRKPDPTPLEETYRQLGGQGLYVGDSDVDAETAHRAGVPFLLFTEGYRKSPVSALPHRAAFSDFRDLPRLVAAALENA